MIAFQIAHTRPGPFRLCTCHGELRAILLAPTYSQAVAEARDIVRDNPLHFPILKRN